MVHIKNISKSFDGELVLKDIDMAIDAGEFVSILGPSGCGKTTLLRIIAGLEMQDNGSIFIKDVCCDDIPARKRGAVIVFQDYGLFPHMTVKQNIEFGLLAQKMKREERERKITHMLDMMQISDKAQQYPRELSGGQKQRVALARSCILEPAVLLLDEPFSNLDTNLKDAMREFVLDLQQKLGITTILVTHDKEEAFMLSQRVAVMLEGELQQFDTPSNIYLKPKTANIADFVGEANYIEGSVQNGYFTCPLGHFDASEFPDGEAKLMLRYDHVLLATEQGEPCQQDLSCLILDKKYKGRVTTYHVVLQNMPEIELYVNTADNSFEEGQSVFIKVPRETGHILSM